jgi:hypothetical protein
MRRRYRINGRVLISCSAWRSLALTRPKTLMRTAALGKVHYKRHGQLMMPIC